MFYNSDDCSYKPQIILYKLCNKRFGANLKYYPVCTCLTMSCLFTASFNVSLSPIRYYEATILCVKVSLSKLTDCKQIKCAVPQVCYDGQGYVSRITIIQQLCSRISETFILHKTPSKRKIYKRKNLLSCTDSFMLYAIIGN